MLFLVWYRYPKNAYLVCVCVCVCVCIHVWLFQHAAIPRNDGTHDPPLVLNIWMCFHTKHTYTFKQDVLL